MIALSERAREAPTVAASSPSGVRSPYPMSKIVGFGMGQRQVGRRHQRGESGCLFIAAPRCVDHEAGHVIGNELASGMLRIG